MMSPHFVPIAENCGEGADSLGLVSRVRGPFIIDFRTVVSNAAPTRKLRRGTGLKAERSRRSERRNGAPFRWRAFAALLASCTSDPGNRRCPIRLRSMTDADSSATDGGSRRRSRCPPTATPPLPDQVAYLPSVKPVPRTSRPSRPRARLKRPRRRRSSNPRRRQPGATQTQAAETDAASTEPLRKLPRRQTEMRPAPDGQSDDKGDAPAARTRTRSS